ncbi:MAG: helix-turn-helix domain-containing protein, partial [Nocardioides sp.]
MAETSGRDRLRELLDAVLDDEHRSLTDMLERAAWQLRHGASVTDAAFAAGYESVEGFSRAFARAYGHLPSEVRAPGDTWLPAPNGIHFHPPTSLWVHTG